SQSWTQQEKAALQDLRLVEGPALPDRSNRYAADDDAAQLGHRFFFDVRFSSNGKVSCATCHVPAKNFQDGTQFGTGVGTTGRRTMPIAGADHGTWFFWDGRKDSLWAQALGPLENSVEHGGDRTQYALLVSARYASEYQRIFGALPDLAGVPSHASPNGDARARAAWQAMTAAQRDGVNRVFANIGKAIAAYERKVQPGVSRFDRYVDAVTSGEHAGARSALSGDEIAGLRLFIGKASCTQCHNGPQLTNNEFANIGVADASGRRADEGRFAGTQKVVADEFNCLGPYSDARPQECAELKALAVDARTAGRMKVPSLRNVAERAPFMHAGQFSTLEEVVDHYDRAPAAPIGQTEIKPLRLSAREKAQLVLFLRSLSAPLATDGKWLSPPPSESETIGGTKSAKMASVR
ncbi:MAG TPA: cytochrome c peroxidase, partial [Myxococcales bacterium]|nr:cytochrome c peroxidase [Myxococcales bacterium]